MLSVAVLEDVVPTVAVIVAVVAEVTAVVVTVKLTVVAPAGTVTLAGVEALEVLEARLTIVPPDGAGPPSVTVPVEDNPPTTVVGEREKPTRVGGLMVSVA